MRTIFIPLYQGYTARNFFYTDVFKTLKNREDLRLVIFTSKLKADYYRKKFGSNKVIIEELEYFKESGFRKFFTNLCYYSIPTRSGYIQIRRFFANKKKVIKLIYRLLVNRVLARIKLYRMLLRWFDQTFLTLNIFEKYFEKYQPDLVYLPHFINLMDMELSKEAKKRGVPRIGLVNSWDNVSSRGICRALPDKIIAHNHYVRDQLKKYHDFPKKNVFMSGIPQFDIYFKGGLTPREEFLKKAKIPITKRYILFCPIGKRFSKTEWQVVMMIDQTIKEGQLPKDLHILIRNNPVLNMYLGDLKENENITIEYPGKKFEGGGMNDWEFTEEDIQHLADSICYSELYVGCASTMVMDSVAYNKPLICINFDGNEKLSFYEGINWTFTSTHYKTIIETGAVTLANNKQGLIEWINKYLQNPKLLDTERKQMLVDHCFKIDGLAGQRVGEFILKYLDEKK